MSRECSKCGEPYYRRHLAIMWVVVRQGERLLYRKISVPVGADPAHAHCMSQRQVRQIAQVAEFSVTGQERALLAAPIIDITKFQKK